MPAPAHPTTNEIALNRVLAALGDPVRLGLVRMLADGEERAWGDLRVPVAKSTLSHHLRTLRDAGVTRTRQQGTRRFIRLRREDLEARFPGLLEPLLAAAGDTAEVSGTGCRVPAAGRVD